MATLPEQIAVAASGAAFILCILYIAAYRPVILISFFFILFTLVWRTAATMFIDLAGPVLSSQTDRYVGPGLATPLHVLAYFVTLAPFFLLLRPAAVQHWLHDADRERAAPGMITLSGITVVVSLVFLGYLYFDLIRIGTIPLFARLERFVYTAQYAGAAHRWLILYGNFVTFWWGVMFAAERLRNRRIDIRYLGMLGILMLYMFLTGNRFSAFYSFGSFFVTPLAAVIAADIRDNRSAVPFSWIGKTFRRRDLMAFSAVVVLAAIVSSAGIYNNLANVRQFQGDEILSQFWERLLVQPSELGWISYERVFSFGQWQPDRVFDFLFQAPLDASRNTTPQFLMLATIGEPRTYEHISGRLPVCRRISRNLLRTVRPRLCVAIHFRRRLHRRRFDRCGRQGRHPGPLRSAFLSLYVLFGFYVMYIGGMLNFIATPVYWIKIAALATALLLEASLAKAGLPLVPWALFRVPA